MKKQFPKVPEDVTGLSDDELARLQEQGESALADVEESDTDRYDEVKEGIDGLARVRDELGKRSEAAQQKKDAMNDLLTKARGGHEDEPPEDEEGEPETDAEGTEPEADEEDEDDPEAAEDDEEPKATDVEPIAASGRKAEPAAKGSRESKRALKLAKASAERKPQPDPVPSAVITAAAEVPGFAVGTELAARDVVRAMMERFRNLGQSPVGGEQVPVARVTWADHFPDERRLLPGAEMVNMERIRQAVGRAPQGLERAEAITASGGLCAPVEIRYDLPVFAQADRPVRDSLTNFNAVRGGVRFAPPPALSSITTAVGRITAAADAAGGSGAQKGCQVIACPSFQEVDVAAIYHCLQFGNMGSRAFPELVENATELTMAAWARVAETALLDAMKAASTKATVALTPSNTAALGANAILLPSLLRAAAAMRNRQRMDPEAILDVWLPAWSLDLLTSDIIRSAFDRFSQNDADIVRTIESFGLRVNFYWDGTTGGNQVYGAQTNAAPLLEFPTTVEFVMAPAGSFLFLDGGTLDLGLVRDSVLNKTNDYQIFGESWENLAFVGIEALHVTASVCDTGAVAAAVQSVCGS
jgi:hypothetical protein